MPEEALDNFHLPIANSEIHYGKDQPRFFYPSLNRDGSEPSRQKWIVTPSGTYKRTAFGADTPPTRMHACSYERKITEIIRHWCIYEENCCIKGM